MSVFDKFRANKYVSTYIGAPVNEMAAAMAARTQRADRFYAQEDALEDAFMNDKHLQADDALFNEKQKEIREQIEELSKNPHQSERQIKALSRQYANNETLRTARKNYTNYQTWQTKFDEDPTKYGGDVVAGIAAQQLANYKGAAAGDQLKMASLYEHKDINKTLAEAAKTIKENQDVVQTTDGRFLNTKTNKYVTREEAEAVLLGTLMNDPTIVKQIQEYAGYYGIDPNDYARQLVAPQAEAVAHSIRDVKSTKLSSGRSGGGSGSGSGNPFGMSPTHAGPSVFDETHGRFRGMEVNEMINNLRGGGPEQEMLRNEFVEFFTNRMGMESASAQNSHLTEYIKENGMDAISQLVDGNFTDYKRWHLGKYDEVGTISNEMQRNLSSNHVNSWFGSEYGDDAGTAFADAYSTGTGNIVIEDAQSVFTGLGFKAGEASRFAKETFTQLLGQSTIEVMDANGKTKQIGIEEFQQMGLTDGELIGVGQSSDYGEFRVKDADGVEQIMYIRLPKDRFGLTSQRFNQKMMEGYGNGTNVNYQKLGQSAMGLNRDLTKQARVATARLYDGDNMQQIPLNSFSNMTGFAKLQTDVDGDVRLIVEGKDILATNEQAQRELTNAINRQDAQTVAGILAGIGVELNKAQ